MSSHILQGITIKGINKNAKYKLKYTISQVANNGTIKYTYSKLILPVKKYTYST